MGIRGNNHIKIIRNTPIQPLEKSQRNSSFKIDFAFDINKLAPAGGYLADKKINLYDNTANLSDKDLEFYKKLLDNFRKNLSESYPTVPSLIWTAYSSIHNNPSHFAEKLWFFGQERYSDFTKAMLDMELMYSADGDVYTITDKGNQFIKLFDKIGHMIPFDWDNLYEKDYCKKIFSTNGNSFTSLETSSGEYLLELEEYDPWDPDVALNTLEPNYQNSMLYKIINPKQQYPEPNKIKSIRSICSKPENKLALNTILTDTMDSINRSTNIEVTPIATDFNYSILQGVFDSQPLYMRIDNDDLKYYKNTYGNDLRMILDIAENTEEDGKQRKMYIVKDNEIVASCRAYTYFSSDGEPDKDRVFLSSLALNMARLKEI